MRNVYAVLLAITLMAIALLFYDTDDYALVRSDSNMDAQPPQLTVSQWKNQLQLKWNAAADALRGASGADLIIADGASRTHVPLNADALRRGNIVYAPHTGDVSFELHTYGPRPQVASVRFLGAVTSAPVEAASASAQKPEPFGDAAPQTGTADRAMPHPHRPTVPAAVPAEPAPTPHAGVFTRVKHRFAKLWPLHHNRDGGKP